MAIARARVESLGLDSRFREPVADRRLLGRPGDAEDMDLPDEALADLDAPRHRPVSGGLVEVSDELAAGHRRQVEPACVALRRIYRGVLATYRRYLLVPNVEWPENDFDRSSGRASTGLRTAAPAGAVGRCLGVLWSTWSSCPQVISAAPPQDVRGPVRGRRARR